jgi:hypothetical protein
LISNEFIRQATEEYHEESMSAIPTENVIDHVFSEKFEKNMESVIKKNNHPQLKRVLRMAASFALVILMAGGSVMALSPTARAAVMGWLFGRESDAYVYRSTGTDTDEETITTYDLAEIPEGYTLWQNMVMPNSSLVIYTEDETGRFLKVFAAPNDGSGALYLIPEDATLIPIQLGDIQADYYQSNIESSGSTIVWTDPENDYLVTVDGFFSQEELMNLALNLIKKDVPKPE